MISLVEPGWYLVGLFEWAFGGHDSSRVVALEKMTSWLFYPDAEAMRYSWDHGTARENGKYRRRSTPEGCCTYCKQPGHVVEACPELKENDMP